MTETQALGLMQLAASLWPRQKVPQETVEGYMLLLLDEDYVSCLDAIKHLAKTSKFLPQLSEIIDEAREIRRAGIEEADADMALTALPAQTQTTATQTFRKGQLQIANIRRWRAAIDRYAREEQMRRQGWDAPSREESDVAMHAATVAMMRESARIYAEERPIPTDGERVRADMEASIRKLRGKPAAMLRQMGRVAGGVR